MNNNYQLLSSILYSVRLARCRTNRSNVIVSHQTTTSPTTMDAACLAGLMQRCDGPRDCNSTVEYCLDRTCEPCEMLCEKDRIGHVHEYYQDCFKTCPGYMFLNTCRSAFNDCPDPVSCTSSNVALACVAVLAAVLVGVIVALVMLLRLKNSKLKLVKEELDEKQRTLDIMNGHHPKNDAPPPTDGSLDQVAEEVVARQNSASGPRNAEEPDGVIIDDPDQANVGDPLLSGPSADSMHPHSGVSGAPSNVPSMPVPGGHHGPVPRNPIQASGEQETMPKGRSMPEEPAQSDPDPDREATMPQQPASAPYVNNEARQTRSGAHKVPSSDTSGQGRTGPSLL